MQDDFGLARSIDEVAHVIQVALTPVFLLSGIASLLGVFSSRLARVADLVHSVSDKLEQAPDAGRRATLQRRLKFLRRRSHLLDSAVILGAVGGGATCMAALLLFVGTLRNQAVVTSLFAAFGFALICTGSALATFLVEVLMASRGIRDQVAAISEEVEAADPPDLGSGDASTAGA
ncbi:DUF2721 domain-containing protein [Lichenihabitans sp. Uapishka_5]|uniref:DUF2721 domain-containing protein n=1 Tax=Lichenihabitans sp. Uapishka_5 TaxID=3037302 RepID=UPI0029E7E2E1|nr:DUF2721 domain-containing protein [Lichenihabitans sp. Uapishka_5]MDX7952391.1 DUF2721 domain-containing protein [Lichenihabitans sp. Uapishka_5]